MSGGFARLASKLAEQAQPHKQQVSSARFPSIDRRKGTPMLGKKKQRRIERPGNNMAAPRQFMESNRQPPLSIKG